MTARSAFTCIVLGLLCAACDDSDSGQSGSSAATTTAQNTGASAPDRGSSGRSATTGSAPSADEPDASVSPTAVADYAQPENWLCRPGHNQACDVDLDTTIVQADGTTTLEKFAPDSDPKIDCFYVYPTVSLDTTPNSDLKPGPEEASVVRAQFARFASQCRLFAPMYRQVTLTALSALLGTMGSTTTASAMPDQALGYNDVVAAWRYYLQHDNGGRGVVLVGHSQGSSVLMQLISEQLDASPDKRLIAALLLGTNVMVPKDKDVGATFKNIPICRSNEQLGCVIVYASFRANTPPPADSLLAPKSSDPSTQTACANPAALGGGSAELHSYLSTAGPGNSSTPMGAWVKDGPAIDTPFVSVPGLITGECKLGSMGDYLAITIHGDSNDPRTDDIVGDVVSNGMVSADWGLHLIDVHLTMGNLLDVVHAKAQVYLAR